MKRGHTSEGRGLTSGAPAYRDNLLCTLLRPTLRTSWCILIASSSRPIDAPFILLRWTIHHTRRNTEFPTFPAWANPTALVTLCDSLNTLHADNSTTNPATCLGFHSGPWVSIFGLNIDQPGPHLPEGTEWKAWDEGSGTIDLTGTKPNHQYVCYIKGNLCPGGIDPAPAGTAACTTRIGPPHDTWPGWSRPAFANLCSTSSAGPGPVPMPSSSF